MPLKGVAAASKDYQAKKAAAESGGVEYLSVGDGEEVTVRPLEEGDDFKTYYIHRLPQQGNRYPQVPCPDPSPSPTGKYACKGCEDGHKRSFQFAVNVIHRNSKIPKRDENKKVVKGEFEKDGDGVFLREDRVKMWTGGINVAEDLDHLDGKYGGLTSRDFDVQRTGVKLNTKYRITPTGDRAPLTPNDEKLAGQKYDLNEKAKAPEYEAFYSAAGGNRSGGGDGPSVESQSASESPFRRRPRAED